MSGWITDPAAALSVELVGQRKYDLSSGDERTLPRTVDVRPLRLHDRGDPTTQMLGCVFLVVTEHHDGVADTDFCMD